MRIRRSWLIVLIALLPIISACGKKGDPLPPSGEESTFPRTYPQR